MDITGEKPGKKLGYVLHTLLEEVLIEPSKNTEEYLENRAKALYLLNETELKNLAEAGKKKQLEEETAALQKIAKEHKVL